MYQAALIDAVRKGHLEVVKVLLEYPAVVNNIAARGNVALRLAAKEVRLDVVKKLLEYPAVRDNVAAHENYALRWAADYGHLEVVKVLLEYQAVVDNIAAGGNEALRKAAKRGHHLVCHVIAKKCWGNIQNVPQGLKDDAKWSTIRLSIHQNPKRVLENDQPSNSKIAKLEPKPASGI